MIRSKLWYYSIVFFMAITMPLISCEKKEITDNRTPDKKNEKYAILKLDDVVASSKDNIRWQRVTDFLEERKIKAGYGIIGSSLVSDDPEYLKWITDLVASGLIEFWSHGYWVNPGEFNLGYEEQLRYLSLMDSLAVAKLGINFPVWGPHDTGINEHTDMALSKMPQIKITFGFPKAPVHYKGIVIPDEIRLEYPTHNPDSEAFKAAYLSRVDQLDYFYLQGHPLSWDDERWSNFVKIVEFLDSENVQFVTPSELLNIIKQKR